MSPSDRSAHDARSTGVNRCTSSRLVANDGYYDAAWRRLVRYVLVRDNYECRIRLPGCTFRATSGDHIVTRAQGGARLDPLNVRAACVHCNSVRANMLRGGTTELPEHAGPSRQW